MISMLRAQHVHLVSSNISNTLNFSVYVSYMPSIIADQCMVKVCTEKINLYKFVNPQRIHKSYSSLSVWALATTFQVNNDKLSRFSSFLAIQLVDFAKKASIKKNQ